MRLLIVNADDFGLSRGVNRGIIEAHERGIVTSASLMVNRPAAQDAAEAARRHPDLGLGLHVELRRRHVSRRPWTRIRSGDARRRSVEAELAAQLERFRRIVDRDPTHLDSHQHRHRAPELREVFAAAGEELGVPVRQLDDEIAFCGEFYGHDGAGREAPEKIAPAALVALLEGLGDGVTELGCHPGYDDGIDAWYRQGRAQEVATLCDPAVRDAVDRLGFRLVSFAEVASAGTPAP